MAILIVRRGALLAAAAILGIASPTAAQPAPPVPPDLPPVTAPSSPPDIAVTPPSTGPGPGPRARPGQRPIDMDLELSHTRLPWYAPATIPYEEGMPLPPGYELTRRRRRTLVAVGAALFGAGYVTSALTAATVVAGSDRHRSEVAPLFAPFVGPWITLATSREVQLNDPDRRTNGVLLLVDGVTQIAGAALFIAGMVTREQVLTRTKASYEVSLAPEVLVMGRGAALRWVF